MKVDLYLHIGRNKAGSTTLQSSWEEQTGSLKEADIHYIQFGPAQPGRRNFPSFNSHDELGSYLGALRGGAALVSSELISCLSPDLSRAMATDLAKFNTRLLCYVRPYREWVVSSYKFDVRAGLNGQDFDCYLDVLKPKVSFWPQIEVWGDAIGWENIRVRSLHPRDLEGGNLLSDADFALGVRPPMIRPVIRANASPSWIVTELIRTLMDDRNTQGWSDEELSIAQMIHHHADAAMARFGARFPNEEYLTRQQAMTLQDQYNHDLTQLFDRTGRRLQFDQAGLAERAFLPTADHVPKRIMQAIRSLALDPDEARIHPRAAMFVGKPRFSKLCEG